MLKELLAALRKGGSELDHAFSEFAAMLDHAHWMFIRANEVIKRQADADNVRDALYQRDKSINDLLRSVRRRIVLHLTLNPGSDVAAALTLMSIAKDAERIGDYCKNVFEVGQFYTEAFHVPKYHEPLEAVRKEVETLFGEVATAFRISSPSGAKAAIRKSDAIGDKCDQLIEELLKDKTSVQTHEAVAYSLLARHYKRVASHLANICTGVLGKIEDLDFRV